MEIPPIYRVLDLPPLRIKGLSSSKIPIEPLMCSADLMSQVGFYWDALIAVTIPNELPAGAIVLFHYEDNFLFGVSAKDETTGMLFISSRDGLLLPAHEALLVGVVVAFTDSEEVDIESSEIELSLCLGWYGRSFDRVRFKLPGRELCLPALYNPDRYAFVH